jgi:hypothetical protein
MAATGRRYHAGPPALARLAHIRAVLAARLWLQSAPGYAEAQPWWHSERRIRAALPTSAGAPHVADAEIRWPDGPGRPHAGQVWAVEVELTAKTATRTARIMAGKPARAPAPDPRARRAGRRPSQAAAPRPGRTAPQPRKRDCPPQSQDRRGESPGQPHGISQRSQAKVRNDRPKNRT